MAHPLESAAHPSRRRSPLLWWRTWAPLLVLALGVAVIIAAVGLQPASPDTPSSAETPRRPVGEATPVGVQLFQWPWASIGAECPKLAERGYTFLQTSPPQESITGEPWWIVYQPVSYKLASTLGTRVEYASMVKACRAAGVEVYADVVLNHMTGQDSPGVGSGGSKYEHLNYPGIWTPDDFHDCGLTPDNDIADYSNRQQVQTCELVNLADLKTQNDKVRRQLTAYLADLQSLGVDGFRVDAAKHIPPADLAAIIGGLKTSPKLNLEVIRGGDDEPVTPEQYVEIGPTQEFGYARALREVFATYSFDSLNGFNTASWLPSTNAITFVDNHDTERNGETLSIADPDSYRLGQAFLLGFGYGTPVVYSGYQFTPGAADEGPRRDADGRVAEASCGDGPATSTDPQTFTCNHLDPLVVGMMAFHRLSGDAPAESRAEGNLATITRGGPEVGAVGFVAMNGGDTEATSQVPTGMADGRWCNVADHCQSMVEVKNGLLVTPVPPQSVIAINRSAVEG